MIGLVGTELAAIIPAWAEKLAKWLGPDCGCKEYAAQMNRWGIEGCEERFEEIVDRLTDQASRIGIPRTVSRWKAKQWLRIAIETAKRRASEKC